VHESHGLGKRTPSFAGDPNACHKVQFFCQGVHFISAPAAIGILPMLQEQHAESPIPYKNP
jgi:hypothetical protein